VSTTPSAEAEAYCRIGISGLAEALCNFKCEPSVDESQV
jgi:hypothetical protein